MACFWNAFCYGISTVSAGFLPNSIYRTGGLSCCNRFTISMSGSRNNFNRFLIYGIAHRTMFAFLTCACTGCCFVNGIFFLPAVISLRNRLTGSRLHFLTIDTTDILQTFLCTGRSFSNLCLLFPCMWKFRCYCHPSCLTAFILANRYNQAFTGTGWLNQILTFSVSMSSCRNLVFGICIFITTQCTFWPHPSIGGTGRLCSCLCSKSMLCHL